jgi:hypothetical protein
MPRIRLACVLVACMALCSLFGALALSPAGYDADRSGAPIPKCVSVGIDQGPGTSIDICLPDGENS